MVGAQTYVERVPVSALADRVRTVWVQRVGPRPYLQRNLPTGGIELHCPIGGLPRLVGPLTSADAQLVPPHATVVGVRFWPGAAAPLLGLPAGELVDLILPADDVWVAQRRGSASCSPTRQGRTQHSSGCSDVFSVGKSVPMVRTRWSPRPCAD